ncbi:MAG: hypothetical protein P8X79_08950 [Reinekea sp.]
MGIVLAIIPYAMSESSHEVSEPFGPYQMSHEQHWAIWDNYLAQDAELASRVRGLASQHRFIDNPDLELSLNAGYATAIAATGLQAYSNQTKLPQDIFELAFLWQRCINHNLPIDVFMSLYPVLKDQWSNIAA